MAKRSKYSTALFEVITNSRKPDKPLGRPSGMRALATPTWWFKGRGTAATAAAEAPAEPPPAPYDPNDPTARVTAAALAARASIRTLVPAPAVAPAEPWASASTDTATAVAPEDEEEAEALAARAFSAAVKPPCEGDPPQSGAAQSDAPEPAASETAPVSAADSTPGAADKPVLSRPGLRVALHPERQEMTLRLRYTSAIVGGFALLVAVGLAYIFGRRMSEGPPPARASAADASTADLRKGRAKPEVLDVGTVRQAGDRASARRTGGPTPPPPVPPVVPPTSPPTEQPARPESAVYFDAPLVSGVARRQANLNYAAIVSFPPEMKDKALAARDHLTRSGVPCTVESVPKVTSDRRWHVVVGVRGFPARYSRLTEYNEYVESIRQIGEQFAGRFIHDRFKPTMFKWE